MTRIYKLLPPLPRLEALETFHNVAQLQYDVSLPPGDADVIVVRWTERAFPLVEGHLRGLGYVDARQDAHPGAAGVSWKLWTRGGTT
ncbi:MAG: hypothetical protein ACRDKS_03815 [Actinomycetota bacterium]